MSYYVFITKWYGFVYFVLWITWFSVRQFLPVSHSKYRRVRCLISESKAYFQKYTSSSLHFIGEICPKMYLYTSIWDKRWSYIDFSQKVCIFHEIGMCWIAESCQTFIITIDQMIFYNNFSLSFILGIVITGSVEVAFIETVRIGNDQ